MNNLRVNPVGVDIPINNIQTFLYNKYNAFNIVSYGRVYKDIVSQNKDRVYKNERSGRIFPYFYDSNDEYKEVLLDDGYDLCYFFNVEDTEEFKENGDVISPCEIIFVFNLTNIKGNLQRRDEEIKQEVLEYLYKFKGVFNITEIVRGLDNVYYNFRGISEYFKDLQPYFHLKIRGEILYNINLKCTK